MQVVTAEFIKDKRVLLRYDIDVVLKQGESEKGKGESQIAEDFKLKAGLETLKLCLENASKVIIIGHLGRPFTTVEDEKAGNPSELSAKPIQEWFESHLGGLTKVDFAESLEQAAQSQNKLVLLENVRFFHGEVPGLDYHTTCTSKTCDIDFARRLAALADVYVNEAFSAHNKGASTTIVPTLFPHVKDPEGRLRPRRAAGLHFAKEVRILGEVRDKPKKPFIAIMGGAKVVDKLPVINVLAQKADTVLVGGKLVSEITKLDAAVQRNVILGQLNEDGLDISAGTVENWQSIIAQAKTIVWNGPLGKFEDPKNDATKKIAQIVLDSGAEVVIGGGDTVAALNQYGLLKKAYEKEFVSVGGGAMLKFLAEGTLPTIEALR